MSIRFHLRRHAETHIEGFVHICPSCDRTFTQRVRLKAHVLKVHPGEKLFGCGVCNMAFKTAAAVKTHKQRDHELGLPACRMCGTALRGHGRPWGRGCWRIMAAGREVLEAEYVPVEAEELLVEAEALVAAKDPLVEAVDGPVEAEDPPVEAEDQLVEAGVPLEEGVQGPCSAPACPVSAGGWAGLAIMVTCSTCGLW
jgi:uncharacterized C2H2 Zn-finger protein